MSNTEMVLDNQQNKKIKSVFRNKNFVLLLIGALVSNLGSVFYNFAISLYIYDITDKNAIIAGLYLATGGIAYFIIAPFGGAIVDRLDRVKVVYITDFIRGVTIIIAGYLLYLGISNTNQLLMLFICSVILSINGALFNPAASALPTNILEKQQLQQANSLMQGTSSLYSVIGLMLGATIYVFLGIKIIFVINGLSFIISGFSEMFITTKTKKNSDYVISFKNTIKDIKSGIKYLIGFKPILFLMIYASLFNFFMNPFFANALPYLFKVQLNVNGLYYSFVYAAFPAGSIVSSLILGIAKQKEKIFSILSKAIVIFSFLALGFSIIVNVYLKSFITFNEFIISAILIAFALGLFNARINIPYGTVVRTSVDVEMQGRVFSVLSLIAMGLTPISIAIAGIIIEKLGIMTLYYLISISVIIVAFGLIRNKYIRKL